MKEVHINTIAKDKIIAKYRRINEKKIMTAYEAHNSTKHFTLCSSDLGLKSIWIWSSSAIASGVQKAAGELTEICLIF